MKRLRPFLAALACVSAIAATTVPVAHADPSNPNFGATWTFTDCTGPPGTPSTFDAVARSFTTPSGIEFGAVNWFLTSGTATFQPKFFTNLDTGASGSIPGFANNDLPLVTCNTTSPVSGTDYVFSGILSPVGAH
jgi:hypothetical protein